MQLWICKKKRVKFLYFCFFLMYVWLRVSIPSVSNDLLPPFPWQLCELTECVAVETSLDQCTRETGHWSSRRKLLSEQTDWNWKPWLRWSKQCQPTWQYPLQSRTSIQLLKAYLWTILPCLLQTMTGVPLWPLRSAWQCRPTAVCKATKPMAIFPAVLSSPSTLTLTLAHQSQ